MKHSKMFLTVATVVLLATHLAVASGNGEVRIRLNGGWDKAFIGLTNILEIYVKNDAPIESMTLGFAVTSTETYNWVKPYGTRPLVTPIVMEHGDAVGCFQGGLGVTDYNDDVPPADSFLLTGVGPANLLPVHATSTLCYSLKFTIPLSASPSIGGFCVDNIVFQGGTWTFTDNVVSYAPKFNGATNTGETTPDAAPACFNIVKAPLNGDIDCNGTVTSADIIGLVNYVFKGGPKPCP